MESPNSALALPGPVLTPAQQNQENMNKLEQAVTELLVSSYDPVVGKTIWQCAQCHFSSKVRYTVKQHIETHLAGFTHQCPSCEKTCKTRNALRAHIMRAHTDRPPSMNQNQNQSWQSPSQSNQTSPVMSPDGFMQVTVGDNFNITHLKVFWCVFSPKICIFFSEERTEKLDCTHCTRCSSTRWASR